MQQGVLRRAGFLALLLVPFIAACGGDDDDVEPTATATQPPPTQAAPVIQPTVAPTVAAAIEHVVAAGETLSEIADLYGVTVEAIVEANELEDADLINVGDTLTIPPPAAAGGE